MTTKVLTREELAIHIIENIVKNGEWVNDLHIMVASLVFPSRITLEEILNTLKGDEDLNYVKLEKEPTTYRIGDRFTLNGRGEVILCQVDYFRCCLVSLSDGDRYSTPVKINDPYSITQEEFNEMSEYPSGKFIKI